MSTTRHAARRCASLLLMAASGFAGLGYQIVWTQQCSLWLGHESVAVLAVVTAFFGGLAFGGLTLGARIESSARPVRWYAACELTTALWSLLLVVVSGPFSAWLQRALFSQTSLTVQSLLAFACTFCLFLPATAAMGATLPAMERLTAQVLHDRRSIAALYASNAFGAVVGVLAAAFLLIPTVGLTRSALLCIGLNALCGALSFVVFPRTPKLAASAASANPRRARRSLWRLAFTGLLGIGYEVAVVRVLSQVTEDTVYTFALLLAVYLVGSAAGAAAYQRWLKARADHRLRDGLLMALAAACLASSASLWAAEGVKAWLLDALGGSMPAALTTEALLALLAFGAPTLVMGALFSDLSRSANLLGVSFGRALGINTLAAACAPLIFGVLVLPTLGSKGLLLLIALGYLALTTRRAWLTKRVWLLAAATLCAALFLPPLTFVDIPEGGHLVSYQEGVMAAVSVVEDADGVLRLRIDNRQQEGSSATRHVDARQAWLPLLLHAAPKRALFLGLGTGVTAASAAADASLQVDAVELLPEVIAAARRFTPAPDDGAPRLHTIAADARRYVRSSEREYDVIVSDNFHPARSGSGSLYTVEHFQAVRRRLEPTGVFCQWLPLHQLDLDTLGSIVRSFIAAYPHSWAMIANNSLDTPVLGLVGRADESRFDAPGLLDRVTHGAAARHSEGLGLDDEFAVLGSFIAGPAALVRFAASAELNTDDHPVVAYRAPRVTYAPDSSPRDRLITLLHALSIAPTELLTPGFDAAWGQRLAAYWSARDRFIESGRDVRPSARVEDMLAQVQEPLLAVLRISPDFRPAYDPLLGMATALSHTDSAGARALLTEMQRIQPARAEASSLLAQISDDAPSGEAAER